jgi:hypothetical protein
MGAVVAGMAAAAIALLWVARLSPWNERFASEVRAHDEASVAVMVASILLLVWEASGGIAPTEMRHTLETIAEEQGEEVEEAAPCAPAGEPLPGVA